MPFYAQTVNGVTWYRDEEKIYSVDPPDTLVGGDNNCWSLMVPEERPDNVLMLGVCMNTIGKLIQSVYGDIPTTYVDKTIYGSPIDSLIQIHDGVEYVNQCQDHYSHLIVDFWDDRLLTTDFSTKASWIADHLLINCRTEDKEKIELFTDLWAIRSMTEMPGAIVVRLDRLGESSL